MTAIACWSVNRPHSATNGMSTTRRQRRERQQHAAEVAAGGVLERVDVLEVPVVGHARLFWTGYGNHTRPWRNASACHTKCVYGLKWTGVDNQYSAKAPAVRSSPTRTAANQAPARSLTGARRGPSAILRSTFNAR